MNQLESSSADRTDPAYDGPDAPSETEGAIVAALLDAGRIKRADLERIDGKGAAAGLGMLELLLRLGLLSEQDKAEARERRAYREDYYDRAAPPPPPPGYYDRPSGYTEYRTVRTYGPDGSTTYYETRRYGE